MFRYVHYEVDKMFNDDNKSNGWNQDSDRNGTVKKKLSSQENTILHPPQWIQCDLRFFDTSVLGWFFQSYFKNESAEMIFTLYYSLFRQIRCCYG